MEVLSFLCVFFEILGIRDHRVEVTLSSWLSKTDTDPRPRPPASRARGLLPLSFPCLLEGQTPYLTSGNSSKAITLLCFECFLDC